MLNSIEQYLEHYFNLSERIDYFKRGLQYSAEIEVTNQCTMSCRYCYVEAVNDKGISHDPSFVVSLLKLIDNYGVREIGWIGGEPLMYNGLEDLMAATVSLGMSNVLYTNGTLLMRSGPGG